MRAKFTLKKWWLVVIILVALSNVPPLNYVFDLASNENHYKYSNGTGSFTFVEFKAHDTKMMYRQFNRFKSANPGTHDTVIYRLFNKNPINFWRWGEYIFDPRYKLPYKPPGG